MRNVNMRDGRIYTTWIKQVASSRSVKLAMLIIGMAALTVGMVYLLAIFRNYLDQPLEKYALYAYFVVFVGTLLGSATIFFPAPSLPGSGEPRWMPRNS